MRSLITLCALLPFAIFSANASLNLKLLPATGRNLVAAPVKGTDQFAIVTLTTDPYLNASGLMRALEPTECYLSFEYKSTANTGHTQLFFGSPASEDKAQFYPGLVATSEWKSVTLDITSQRLAYNWGAKGDVIRIDFGNVANVGIYIRHLRIHAVGEPWVHDPILFPTREDVLAFGLPMVEIQTDGNEEPTCDYVAPPEGCIGASTRNNTKVPGSVKVYTPDGTKVYDSGDYVKGESGMTVKVRGNTSAFTIKKPYKIKLQKKGDLLTRGNKKYNDKNWVLIKDELNLMRNGFKINELIGGHPWTPACGYVNLWFNGDYRGLYLLTESVERNTDCRLNVDKTGFVTELDAYWWNEDGAYVNSDRHPTFNWTFRYPDYEDMTPDQILYIQNFLSAFEASVNNYTYQDYIDIPSFARWLLGHDILGTKDAGGSNMYYMKYDNTPDSKLMMANMWDFDSSEDATATDWSFMHKFHWSRYFEHKQNDLFVKEFIRKWDEVYPYLFEEMASFLSEFASSPEGEAFTMSNQADGALYGTEAKTASYNSSRSSSWYRRRKAVLNSQINHLRTSVAISIDDDVTKPVVKVVAGGINVSGVSDSETTVVYDTTGRVVAKASGSATLAVDDPGLYIVATGPSVTKVLVAH